MRRKAKKKTVIKPFITWLLFFVFLNFIPPAGMLSFVIFYLLLSFSLFSTFQLFTLKARSLVWIASILIYLLLRQNHLDNPLNILLLAGILITLEIYFRTS
ncbi:hypothetical protein FJY90_04085 [Candidatus Gottesmanbacteria bacterium]|nr:hypothetical protein [Candidatus Gottesmanbacteria bacterium]